MAESKTPNPIILIDGQEVEMTKEQLANYKKVVAEAESVMAAKKQEQVQKEIAIAKLVALGLTESDIKAVNS